MWWYGLVGDQAVTVEVNRADEVFASAKDRKPALASAVRIPVELERHVRSDLPGVERHLAVCYLTGHEARE